jgi:hypothetical protein
MASSSGSSWVLSWRWPAVTSTASGRPDRRRPGATWWSVRRGYARGLDGGRHRCLGSCRIPVSGAGSVLVRSDDGGIDHDLPVDLPHGVRLGLRVGQQPLPGAVGLPAAEPLLAGLPGAVALRQIPPRRPGGQLPQDPVDHPAMVGPLATRAAGRGSNGAISAQAWSVSSWRLTTCPPWQMPSASRQPTKKEPSDRP